MATENTPETERVEGDPNADPKTKTNPPARKGETPPPPPREEETDDVDALRDQIKEMKLALTKANKLTTEKRLRLEELERKEEEQANAKLSDDEKTKQSLRLAEQRAAEAERRAKESEERMLRNEINLAVEREAGKLLFEYPEIAPQLIDRSLVEKDEVSGRIVGVKEALERLIKDKPGLVLSAPRGGTPPREGPRRQGPNGRQPQETPADQFENDLRGTGKYAF